MILSAASRTRNWRRPVYLLAVLWLAGACADVGGAGGGLACEQDGYPCEYSAVEPDVVARTVSLAGQAGDVLANGGTPAEAAALLEAEDDVAELAFDDNAVRFRLDGGRGHWILDDSAYGTRSTPGTGSGAPAARSRGFFPHVVNDESDAKSAIVLSPVKWDFGTDDEGAEVAGILTATRGYEGRVDYYENDAPDSTDVGFGTYKGFAAYDVVHVSSHGATVCESGECTGVVMGFDIDAIPGADLDAKIDAIDEPGIELIQDSVGENIGVGLSADFFRTYYPGGLRDTVIYFSACESLAQTSVDLAGALRGADSVFIGWDRSVRSDFARLASLAMYERLSAGGHTTQVALTQIEGLAEAEGARLRVAGPGATEDLRIRDVIELLNPDTGTALVDAQELGIVGEPGDGEPDSARWSVRVDGITAEQASDSTVRVVIDGTESEPTPVSAGTEDDQERWTLSGEIELPYDVSEDTPVDVRAWVDLADGGVSDAEAEMTLITAPAGEWVLEIDYSRTPVNEPDGPGKPDTATATLILAEADLQIPDSGEVTYEVVGGTVTYDPSFTDRFCQVIGDPITFEVTPEMVGISRVSVDTTTSPSSYTAYVSISGPEYEAEWSCRAGTGDDAPEGYQDPEIRTRSVDLIMLDIEEEDRATLSADGASASGTWVWENTSNPGAIRESAYTLTSSP